VKRINIEVDSSCGTLGLPVELLPPTFTPHAWQVDEYIAFTIIAIATSPPVHVGFSLADTWAHKRYLAALHAGSKLRLRREWEDIDSHQKTILADDFGVGFPLLYLQEKLELIHFSPTGWWLKALERSLGTRIRLNKKKNGPPKLPDYICVDSCGYFHAIENKGTQTSKKMLADQIKAGVAQVENLRAAALPSSASAYFRSWMVGGIFIPQYRSKSDATIVLADPDFSELLAVLDGEEAIERAQEAVRLVSLCQQLASIGLRRLGSALFTGRADARDRALLQENNGANDEVRFMGFERQGDSWALSSEFRTFDSLARGTTRRERVFGLRYSIDAQVLSRLARCIRPSGLVDRNDLDSVLGELAPLRRPDGAPGENFLLLRAFERDKQPQRWTLAEKEGRSVVETPFKIRYETFLDRAQERLT